jgi:hypothetical protein
VLGDECSGEKGEGGEEGKGEGTGEVVLDAGAPACPAREAKAMGLCL